ncbi:caspase-1 [Calliopsis andreniformis]|uniref:caspase-1 n=1 Tax=Calliopsis andreniformis TaxID=337506 RepID=UPI003FCCF4C6
MTDTVVTHPIAYDDEEWERNFIVPTQPDSHAVKLPVRKDDTCYKMDHKERGKCVIFNHDEFDPGVAHPRKGSKADVEAIHRTFKKLNFTVEEHRNCSYWEIQNIIRELAKDDHVDRDCICIFMLTHGTDKGYIYAKDDSYSLTEIWKPFTADKCSSLAGKPKLFFFQACRGNQLDSGITAFTAQSFRMSETDSTDSPFYKIPTHADFLLAYSTMEGFFSWRDTEEGTWYIQCLCDVIERNWRKYDLSKMLTITARIIANDYSSSHENPVKNNQKQMPSLTSTLTRDVIFLPKNNY